MHESDKTWNRLAVIVRFAEKAPKLGRTAIMKYMYLLYVLRNQYLGYKFSLYTYGPFDSAVLDDLSIAETIGGVKSELIPYSNSYGYRIYPGPEAEKIKAKVSVFLNDIEKDIDWVIDNFGHFTSSELEMASTIIYTRNEQRERGKEITVDEITKRVFAIKPHLSEANIREMANHLQNSIN